MSKIGLCLVGALALSPTAAQCQADLQVMVRSGSGLTNLGGNVSINNEGWMAFTANDAQGSKAFVVTRPGVYRAVSNITGSNRSYSGIGLSNGLNPSLAARELVTGPFTIVRRWGVNDSSSAIIGSSSSGDFDSCSSFCDVNDSGVVSDTTLVNGSTATQVVAGVSRPPQVLATYTGNVLIRPQLANNGDVVFRDNIGRIVVINYPSGTFKLSIGSGSGFTSATLRRPGISHDGSTIGFVGDRGLGQGLFISILKSDNTRVLAPVAGETLGDGFTAFSEDQRVGVARTVQQPGDVQQITVVFVGTRNGVLGVYTKKITASDAGVGTIGAAEKILAVGDTVPGTGATATGFTLYDPLNANGGIGFFASLSDGTSALLRGHCIGITVHDPQTSVETAPDTPPTVLRLPSGVGGYPNPQQHHALLLKIQAMPNTSLKVFVVPDQISGGHTHTQVTFRPHGWLRKGPNDNEPWLDWPPYGDSQYWSGEDQLFNDYATAATVTTDANGDASIYYVPPEICGTEVVTVSTVNADAGQRVTATKVITVRVRDGQIDFASLANSASIHLIGGPDDPRPGKAYPHQNHYGSAALIQALQALAINWMDELPASSRRPLDVNDMSLATGGLFDIGRSTDGTKVYGDWFNYPTVDGPHVGHRMGNEADIGVRPSGSEAATFERVLRDQGWWLINPTLWQSEGDHYHVTLVGTGKVTVKPVFRGTTWINETTRTMDVKIDMQNRGGLDSNGGTLSQITATGGVTIQQITPALPLDLGAMAIRGARKSLTIRLTVPNVPTIALTFTGTSTAPNRTDPFPISENLYIAIPTKID